MSTHRSDPYSFQVKFYPSRILFYAGIVLHMLALMACFLMGVVFMVKGLMVVMILVSLCRQYYLFKPQQWAQLTYSDKQGWRYAQGEQPLITITILPSTVITTRWVIIHALTENKQWQAIVIGYDSLADDYFRQLRVNLKIFN